MGDALEEPGRGREAAKETRGQASGSASAGGDPQGIADRGGAHALTPDPYSVRAMRVGEVLAVRWKDRLLDRIIVDERVYDPLRQSECYTGRRFS